MATYDPQRAGIPSNKGAGVLGKPVDARSWIVDDNFTERNFNTTAEAIAYFDTSVSRQGKFSVYITADSVTKEYWWRDGVADSDLILKLSGGDDVPLPTSSNDTFIIL